MVLITSWKQCIQAVKMKMAPDVIHTLILLWKSAQMLTWLRTWVIQFTEDQRPSQPQMEWDHYNYHHNMESDRKVSISQTTLGSFRAMHLSISHHSLAFLSMKNKKQQINIFFSKTDCTNHALPSNQKLFLSTQWCSNLALPPQPFSCQGLYHCWASHPNMCSPQRMSCNLTVNV